LQMPFIFASTLEFSAAIAASPGIDGPGVTVPSIRPPLAPARLPPTPTVPGDPVEFAVPSVLVPGALALAELPAPLGSLTELFEPPTLPGPGGTPLTAAVPVSADPAFGAPTAVPVPPAPLVTPPADAPAEPPPAPPPAPPLCANAVNGQSTAATINTRAKRSDILIVLRSARAARNSEVNT
jgi:hypothetical protein